MLTFPYTKKYFINFGSQTGLTPTWVYYRRTDTMADVTPHPTITALGNGVYYFTKTWELSQVDFGFVRDPEIFYMIDGGAAVTDPAMRYVIGVLETEKVYEAFEVWSDENNWKVPDGEGGEVAYNQGALVQSIGHFADNEYQRSVFGRIRNAIIDIKGGDYEGIFTTGGNNIKQVYDRIGDPTLFMLLDSVTGNGPGQITTVSQMVQETWLKASQLKADILGGDYFGESWQYGLDLRMISGTSILGPGSTDFNPSVNSIKYISENLGGGGGGGGGGTIDYELRAMVQRALGMLHENSVLDQTTFTGGNLGSARLRLYDSAVNAAAAQAASNTQPPTEWDTGKLAVYSISATYTGTNLKDYLVTLEWVQGG